MLDLLSDRIQAVVRRMRGRGALSEANVKDAMREIRMALIEADVHFRIARDFVQKTAERCNGQDVLRSVTPGQQFVKIIQEELTQLMGGATGELDLSGDPAVILLAGLHGSGKTTTAAKLAVWCRKRGRTPLLVACDIYRPAAIDQLETLGRQIDVPVYADRDRTDPATLAADGLARARDHGCNVVIVDTAGRLHVDENLVGELVRIRDAVRPRETLLVADAATGQEAVTIASRFHEAVALTGIVLTKLDGDARGGAALSMRAATGCPIMLVGLGEQLDALQPFHPERMASRILGMGDVVSLVERAQATVDEDEARRLHDKIRRRKLDLEDFLSQVQQLRRLGSVDEVLGMLPGAAQLGDLEMGERDLTRAEAIVRSMTREERLRPEILNASRRRRIARGSGSSVADVNQLLKQFQMMQRMLKQMGKDPKALARGMRMPRSLRRLRPR